MDVTAALSAARWAALTDGERRATAEQLLRQLPSGFALVGVEGRVACFEHDDRTYALVPGGSVPLGFDVARWQPSKDERKSWTRSAKEYRLPELHDYLAKVMQRPRDVALPALLVATRPEDVGWEPLALDDPRLADLAPSRTDVSMGRVFAGGEQFELAYTDGRLSGAWRARKTTHADEVAALQRTGFRLPTSDEWEHACGAGASTLFRWGDHAPCDRYPPDASVEAAELVSDFDHHRRPNAFGLQIASDPYQSELTAEAGVTRGGDGGSMICGGAGYFMGWLPLATAWFDPAFCRREAGKPIEVGYTVMRRVLPLA